MRLLRLIPFAVLPFVPTASAADSWGFEWGVDALVGAPTGQFAQHVSALGGVAAQGAFGKHLSPLAIRIDGSLQFYGSETQSLPIGSLPARITQDVETDHWVSRFDVGPELRATSGSVRPFVNPFVGFSYFNTSSSLIGPYPLGVLATSTNYDDFAFSYGVGAGVRIMVGSGGGALSISGRYVRSSRTSYLTNGDILQSQTGTLVFTPQHSQGDTLEFRVGYAFGIGQKSR